MQASFGATTVGLATKIYEFIVLPRMWYKGASDPIPKFLTPIDSMRAITDATHIRTETHVSVLG